MSTKTWNAGTGLFSSPWNWLPDAAPAAGDDLHIESGIAILVDQTFGSDSALSTISLAGLPDSDVPKLVMINATLKNVHIDESPTFSTEHATDSSHHGTILVEESVTNDGGVIESKNLFE